MLKNLFWRWWEWRHDRCAIAVCDYGDKVQLRCKRHGSMTPRWVGPE